MRRVLYIIESLARRGAAAQLLVLSRGLAAEGFDVHVAALGGRGAMIPEFHQAGIATCQLDRRWMLDPIASYNLNRLMRRLRPDAVHTWDRSSAGLGLAAARWCGIRHAVVGIHRLEKWNGAERIITYQRLAQGTAQLVTASRYIRDCNETHGFPPNRFTTISPGIPTARPTDVSREELLRQLQLPANARLIGVVGRLIPEKRVKDLIWAADLLRVLHDNLRLLIIGDGPLRAQLEQYARLASDLDHIRFLGERTDVWRIMPHLDVLWNASENRGQSIAILEAMAAGVPVIASDTPLNREFVVEGETGYLIPQQQRSGRADRARHTDRIFTNHDLAARLGNNARRRVSDRCSVQRFVLQYADLYNQCVLA
jgi:glycosyltransferase involved in cell wall biosynthesis